jgi:hypothetical protein
LRVAVKPPFPSRRAPQGSFRYAAKRAVDGNSATRWEANKSVIASSRDQRQWLLIDLGENCRIEQARAYLCSMSLSIYIEIYVCMHVCMSVCMSACLYVCVHDSVSSPQINIEFAMPSWASQFAVELSDDNKVR